MPPSLHPYLKRGLELDTSPIHASDLVGDISTEQHDAQKHTAKKRRVEAIALQYLRGQPPIILTASLKGPFTKEWKNPWTKDVKAGPDGKSKPEVEHAEEQRKSRSEVSQVASPEASRAVRHSEEHMYSQPELEPLRGTAPLPDEDESGATEFFSVETEEFIANHSPANPFWLRRPTTSITFPANSQTDKSPTRTRDESNTTGTRRDLQLPPPKEPLGGRSLRTRAVSPDQGRSSASAPMDISSLTEPLMVVKHHIPVDSVSHTDSLSDAPDSSRLRADSAQEEEARSSQAAQIAQTTAVALMPASFQKRSTTTSPQAHPAQLCSIQSFSIQSFDTFVPATTYKTSATVQVPQSSPIHGGAEGGSQGRLSREDILRSAERLATMMSRSATRRQPASATRQTPKKVIVPKKLRHNLVASPAPASSTGFVYRRVNQPKSESNHMPKAKPRAVNSSSSPTLKKKAGDPLRADPETLTPLVETEVSENVASHTVVEPAVRSTIPENNEEDTTGLENEKPENEQQESYRSKQSQYSTQAAMLLAQLEFQEDLSSQPPTSSATLRPWSQPAHNTPRPHLLQPSPAITPLSVFNAHFDDSLGDLGAGSALRGPPISTQDLFNAASPFAFSTVKKSERPRRTSLRFAVTSRFTESAAAKSPTPVTDRIPLKEKNTPTLWSFTHEKSSLCSPNLTTQSPNRTTNDVELSRLDFHMSLDDFGPNADIHFTDCFLKGLNKP